MITRQELLSNRELLADKTRGALSGLAIGDSFGDAARTPDNQRDYGFITDFHKGDSWSTDDTEFALMVAKTIIDAGGDFTSQDVVNSWLENVATEDELRRGGVSEVEACNNPYHQSDGAAMRSGPIGIYCAGDPEKAKYLAGVDAEVSHSEEGIWGAQAVAVAVSLAMVDADMDQLWAGVMDCAPKGSWFEETLNRAAAIVERSGGNVAEAWMPLHNDLFSTHRSTVCEALPEVFGCLKLKHDTFKSGLLLACNFGRDADTIGAVAGAVLGARYGAHSIPQHWITKTRYPSGTCLSFTKGIDILEYADKIAALMK